MRQHQRLAYIGKFSIKPKAPVFKLHADAPQINLAGLSDEDQKKLESEGQCSEGELFRLLQPTVYRVDDIVELGETKFNGYYFAPPTADPKLVAHAKTVSIGLDSALLRDEDEEDEDDEEATTGLKVDKFVRIQKEGARLFRTLAWDLDGIAKFEHPNFARAVFELAMVYLTRRLESDDDVGLDSGRWATRHTTHYPSAALLVRAMLCHPADLTTAIQAYWDATIDDCGIAESHRVHAGTAVDTFIRELREELVQGPPLQETSDPVLQEFVGDHSLNWMLELAGKRAIPKAPVDGKSRSVKAYYKAFRERSDRVHQAMRTPALGSYLFCFLAGKYQPHDSAIATRKKAAARMAKLGVVEQKEKRRPGLSIEEAAQIDRYLRELQAGSKVPEGVTELEEYRHAKDLADRLTRESVRIRPRFTREELAKLLEDLFVSVAKLAGGSVEKILRHLQETQSKLLPLFYAILRIGGRGADKMNYDQAVAKLQGDKTLGAEARALLKKVIAATAGQKTKTGKELRHSLRDAFLRCYQTESDGTFDQDFGAVESKIAAESGKARRQYRLRRDLEVGGGAGAGTAGATLTTAVIVEAAGTDSESDAGKKEMKVLQGTMTAGATIRIEAPLAKASAKSVANGDYDIFPTETPGEKEKPLGNIMVSNGEKERQVVIEGATPATIRDLATKGKKGFLRKKGSAPKSKATQIDVLIEEVPDDVKELYTSAEEEAELAKKVQDIVTEYDGGKINKDVRAILRKEWRALICGEYLYSAPQGTVDLDQDDLSLSLRVIMEMIQKLDTDQASLFQVGNELEEGDLMEINLSEAYRLAFDGEDAQMSQILEYHYRLCERFENLSSYLAELRDLRRLVRQVGPKVEIIVVNDTLDGYINSHDVFAHTIFGDPDRMPALAYVTRQSGGGFATVAGKLSAQKFEDRMVVPIFCSADETSADLPIAKPQKALPRFPKAFLEEEFEEPLLPWFASMISGAIAEGPVKKRRLLTDKEKKDWKAMSGHVIDERTTLLDLTLGVWKKSDSYRQLASAELMTRVLARLRELRADSFHNLGNVLATIKEACEPSTFKGLAFGEDLAERVQQLQVWVAGAARDPVGTEVHWGAQPVLLGDDLKLGNDGWWVQF